MRPWVIAHRGGAGLRPENTLAAFRNAVEMGCDGAELDVQLSRDGKLVVYHDYKLKPEITRGADGAWLPRRGPRIKDLTSGELREFDIGRADPGSKYAREHPDVVPADGERIPTLDEVLAIAKAAKKPFHLQVELKTSFSDRSISAKPEALAEAAVEVLRSHAYADRATLVGFDWPGLLHARRIAPEIPCWFTTLPQSWFGKAGPPAGDDPPSRLALQTLRYWAKRGTSPWAGGFDAVNFDGSIVKAIQAAGGAGWFPYLRDATAQAIAEAHGLGLKVGAWTANEAADMRALIAGGIDAICTDRPDVLAGILTAE